MKKLLYFLFIIFSFTATAQVPEPHMLSLQVLGGSGAEEFVSSNVVTPDGGFIILLSTNSTDGPIADTFVCPAVSTSIKGVFIKYNSTGTIREWYKCRQFSWSDTGYIFMFQTLDDRYVLGGVANSGNKWVIRKEDALGNVLWIKAYGGSGSQMLYSMIETDDGGYIFFGSAYGGDGDIGFHYGSPGTRDFWVLKVDANGDKVWSKVYGGTSEDIGGVVVSAPGGGCYIVGSTNSTDFECAGNHGGTDVCVARMDNTGNIIWRRMLGGSGFDGGGESEGCAAIEDGKGGLLIATISGSNDGDVSHQINYPGSNIWVINIDSSNNIVWDNCYGGGGAEWPNSVCGAGDGSLWIAGVSRNVGVQINHAYGNKDAVVLHIDSIGNFLNAKVLGSSGIDCGYLVYPLSDGNVLAGGYYGAGNGVFPNVFNGGVIDAFLVKYSNWANEIQPLSISSKVIVFPNPANESVNIKAIDNSLCRITVYDILGRMMYDNTITKNIQIPVNEWRAGLYFVQIVSENGYTEVQKLTVQ
jgi:hypothetical protein